MPLQLKLLSAPADAAVGYTADSSRGAQDEFLMDLVKVHVKCSIKTSCSEQSGRVQAALIPFPAAELHHGFVLTLWLLCCVNRATRSRHRRWQATQ